MPGDGRPGPRGSSESFLGGGGFRGGFLVQQSRLRPERLLGARVDIGPSPSPGADPSIPSFNETPSTSTPGGSPDHEFLYRLAQTLPSTTIVCFDPRFPQGETLIVDDGSRPLDIGGHRPRLIVHGSIPTDGPRRYPLPWSSTTPGVVPPASQNPYSSQTPVIMIPSDCPDPRCVAGRLAQAYQLQIPGANLPAPSAPSAPSAQSGAPPTSSARPGAPPPSTSPGPLIDRTPEPILVTHETLHEAYATPNGMDNLLDRLLGWGTDPEDPNLS